MSVDGCECLCGCVLNCSVVDVFACWGLCCYRLPRQERANTRGNCECQNLLLPKTGSARASVSVTYRGVGTDRTRQERARRATGRRNGDGANPWFNVSGQGHGGRDDSKQRNREAGRQGNIEGGGEGWWLGAECWSKGASHAGHYPVLYCVYPGGCIAQHSTAQHVTVQWSTVQ